MTQEITKPRKYFHVLAVVSQITRSSLPVVALILAFGPGSLASAQTFPLQETRGVWFATVLSDGNWPVSSLDSATKQENDLRARIQHARSLELNTFVFQAVARGDAMYPSQRLPWSARLRSPAEDPGYDPLSVAVDEAHRLGMELHAWINVYRVGDVSTVNGFASASNPGHVYFEHPGWVQNVSGALWVDPSSTDAREWLVDNVLEIVDNYDIDAVHFDFIRYPSGGLADDLQSFQFDDRGFDDIDDWRRDNVTEFVRDVSTRIWQSHPWMKIGSAPFGNYESFSGAWPAAWALTDVFQESREWLAEGIHDYVAPQIYFDIGRDPEPPNTYDSPDFSYLVTDWVANSSGRPIFVGHGPYKPVVLEELDQEVALTRTESAAGQFFFRYDHIKNFNFNNSYPGIALTAPMTHRFESAAPTVPTNLLATNGTDETGATTVELTWSPSSGTPSDPLQGYAIFRNTNQLPDTDSGKDLIDFVWATETTYSDSPPNNETYTYQLVAVSRLGARSSPSVSASNTPVGTDTVPLVSRNLQIGAIYPNPANERIEIRFAGPTIATVDAVIVDLLGRQVFEQRFRTTANGSGAFQVDVRGFASGLYSVMLRSKSEYSSRTFVVVRH